MEIEVSERELANRWHTIQRMLRPISPIHTGPACDREITTSYVIWGVHDGARARRGYREWRFSTRVHGYVANYFEYWVRLNRNRWYLHRAYLTIFAIDQVEGETEYLCLHCDPNEPPGTSHAAYKQGPHLHIKKANHPIPHAHLALNKGHLENVLESVSSLTKAMEDGITMIRTQVLDQM